MHHKACPEPFIKIDTLFSQTHVMTLRICLTCFLLIFLWDAATAQRGDSFQQANNLAQQGELEEAVEMYARLLQRNPENVPVIDRKVTALVQLREFDRAIELLTEFTGRNPGYPNISVRAGEIYHMKGEREKAAEWWRQIIEANDRNVQVYRLVAESMVSRREHEKAALLYREARQVMQNEQMFGFEIAQNFTAAGNYEESMREYSHLLSVNSGFISAIQRQISRYEDSYYRDVGIMEFEEASRNLRTGSEEWISHRKMLIWLYNERELYRRSFATARNLEERLDDRSFPLFELGRQLVNLNEFELAEDAFKTYSDNPEHDLYIESRKELARLYIRHARYLLDFNLDFGSRASRMYSDAYELLTGIHENKPGYRGITDIYALLIEISLDYIKDSSRAREWLTHFENNMRGDNHRIMLDYLEGRIQMFGQDFDRARIALSRANRAAGTGELAQRSRYFLSLNDFYAGQFEFARLQMRSLQRQTTSYYANDALRLRSLIQEGIVQDSTTAEIGKMARAMFHYNSAEYGLSLEVLTHFVDTENKLPLQSEAMLMMSRIMKKYDVRTAFTLLDRFIGNTTQSPQLERLYWERARLADAWLSIEEEQQGDEAIEVVIASIRETLTGAEHDPRGELASRPDQSRLVDLYEELIIRFPSGFYASEARQRIRTLQQTTYLSP